MVEIPLFKENPEGLPEIEFGEGFLPFLAGIERNEYEGYSTPSYYLTGVGKVGISGTEVGVGGGSIPADFTRVKLLHEKKGKIKLEDLNPMRLDVSVYVDYEIPGKDPNFICVLEAGDIKLVSENEFILHPDLFTLDIKESAMFNDWKITKDDPPSSLIIPFDVLPKLKFRFEKEK